MLNKQDKLKILNNRVDFLIEYKQHMINYIDLINNGMEDASLDIDFCNKAIDQYDLKINALNTEKEILVQQQN